MNEKEFSRALDKLGQVGRRVTAGVFDRRTFVVHVCILALGFCVGWVVFDKPEVPPSRGYDPLGEIIPDPKQWYTEATDALGKVRCASCGQNFISAQHLGVNNCPTCELRECVVSSRYLDQALRSWKRKYAQMDKYTYPGFCMDYLASNVAANMIFSEGGRFDGSKK